MGDKIRCEWVNGEPFNTRYHDLEWGVPEHSDTKLFELLTLEGAQAGLSWTTILKKREGYKKAFDNFDVTKVARYDTKKVRELLNNPGIIRNKLKVASTIQNAKAVFAVKREFGSFDKYIWGFVNGKTIKNSIRTINDYHAKTKESEVMSADLLKKGFRFVGPTICYAFMEAVGMVNDHQVNCFRYNEV